MLQRLSIRNYALIKELDIEISNGLSIITGETGAGKSILIGALRLITGQRSDSNVLFEKDKKCIVEGVFNIKSYSLEAFFNKNELDFELQTTIRREINTSGKSRAFVNDTPVKLDILRELGSYLLDVHSQHDMRSLNSSSVQLEIVDAYAQNEKILSEYKVSFKQYSTLKAKYDELVLEDTKSRTDRDYYQFLFDELEDADLQENELEGLKRQVDLLNNSEEIKSNLEKAIYGLQEGDLNILNQLNEINGLIRSISIYSSTSEDQLLRLESCYLELKDIHSELEILSNGIEYDGEKLIELSYRQDLINSLLHKHNKNDIQELILLKNEFSDRLINISTLENEIKKLGAELDELNSVLIKKSDMLTKSRKNVLLDVENEVHKLLSLMSMSDAQLNISFDQSLELNRTGRNKVQFLFSANKGSVLQELSKVASGGELSRLMLAIKSVVSKLIAMPTIIFDEIDTGVSGEVADKVGRIMVRMAESMQVISITHLPQIASKGESHFFVSKSSEKERTTSEISLLNENERINEIAKMLSGDGLSDAAIQNAKELLNT
ncbi:MAG: DNA repair protein RecN [Flavobacteriales bacterium]|nr:DNA repair protein RecN [Flavobacteriales bacterium]